MKIRLFTFISLTVVAVLFVSGMTACTRAKPIRPEIASAPTSVPGADVTDVSAVSDTVVAVEGAVVASTPASVVAEVKPSPTPLVVELPPTPIPGMPTPTVAGVDEVNQDEPTPAVTLIIPLTPPVDEIPTPAPTSSRPPGTVIGKMYTVKEQDTLFSIAVRFGTSVEEIMEANNLDSDLLSIGQELVIPVEDISMLEPTPAPPPPPVAPQPQTSAPMPAPGTAGGRIHVVKPGENLFRIALKYNVSLDAIAEVNNIVPPWYIIYPGQQLVIP